MKIIKLFAILFIFSGFIYKVSAQTDSPILVLPPEEQTNVSRTPEFSWKPIDGATDYIIVVIRQQDDNEVINTTTKETIYKSTVILNENTTYIWKVGVVTTVIKNWSAIRKFTTGDEIN